MAARRALLVAAAAAAGAAVWGGLARIGLPLGSGAPVALHGPLFVFGTFVTVIALERAVALGSGWSYAAPLLSVAGAVALLAGAPGTGRALALAAALALVAVNVAIVARQRAAFTGLMLLGSATLAAGAAAWAAGRPLFDLAPAWIGFFVLTIAAERLELSRLAPTPRWAVATLVALATAMAVSVAAGVAGVAATHRAFGGALALVGLWQLRFDLARRTLRRPGLPRYVAAGVLAGAAWLLVAGVLVAAEPLPPAGPRYDAALHAVLVGYVLSMVFAHAPIVLPAVARLELPFHPALYVPLAILHAGLVARVAGDLAGALDLRQAGGALNAAALVVFALTVVWTRRLAPRPER